MIDAQRAYATILAHPDHVPAVQVLIESIRQTGAEEKILVISKPGIEFPNVWKRVQIISVDATQFPLLKSLMTIWKHENVLKLWLWKLNYQKVIFMGTGRSFFLPLSDLTISNINLSPRHNSSLADIRDIRSGP